MFNFEPPTILVDGSYLLHRTYHAVPPMYSHDGTSTNAVYGTIKHILHMLNEIHPTYIAVVIDRSSSCTRHEGAFDYQDYYQYSHHMTYLRIFSGNLQR